PPPHRLSCVRSVGRRRLCRRRSAVPDGLELPRLRHRRGRGHLLGFLPRLFVPRIHHSRRCPYMSEKPTNPAPLTTAAGAPVANNENSMTAGPRGPMLLQDLWFLEKLAHF